MPFLPLNQQCQSTEGNLLVTLRTEKETRKKLDKKQFYSRKLISLSKGKKHNKTRFGYHTMLNSNTWGKPAQKHKPQRILIKQWMMSGSGINWTIGKISRSICETFALCSREIADCALTLLAGRQKSIQ